MNPIAKAWRAVKALTFRFSANYRWWWGSSLGSTRVDYRNEVGDGRGNAIVVACVEWACRTFPEAPLRVRSRTRTGIEPIEDHPLIQVLQRPTPHYSGMLLWSATLSEWMLHGNAYWIKVRSATGRVVQLWWVPQRMIEPKWSDDGRTFITHYEYRPDGEPLVYAPSEVVHFRYGMDPDNPRKGLSPIAALYREVFTDNEAANYTAAMCRAPMPGVILSPKGDVRMTPESAKMAKDIFTQTFSGDRRGEPMIQSVPMDVAAFGFSPEQMNLKDIRRIPEERVSAIFGTPAVVVGLGAGLDRSTFANFAEAREAAYESMIIPTQRLFAAELQAQLLPDFGDPQRQFVDFDLSQVRILQEDEDNKARRVTELVKASVLTVNEAREWMGLDSLGPDGDVLLVPGTHTPTDPKELLAEPEPMALPVGQQPPALPPGREPEDEGREAAAALFGELATKADVPLEDADYAARIEGLLAVATGLTRLDLGDYFLGLEYRLAARMGERKAINWRLEQVFPDREEIGLLYDRLVKGMRRLAESAWSVIGRRIDDERPFDPDGEIMARLREAVSERIPRIHETTREKLRDLVETANARGYTAQQFLRGVPENDFPGLRQTVRHWSLARSETIARTELAHYGNVLQIERFKVAGVGRVRMLDGTAHDGTCAARNGREVTLEEYERHVGAEHPNGNLRCAPIKAAAVANGKVQVG